MADQPRGSRQTSAYVCVGVTFAAAILATGLRLTARRLTKVALWWDDWLCIIAFTFAIAWVALVIWWLQLGLGRFLNDINMDVDVVLEKSRLILWNIEIFYAFSLAFSKLSILALYWRIFKSALKNPVIILSSCAIIWLILRTFMAIFHCVPVQAFWDTSIKATCNIDDSKFFFGTVLAHLIIDIAILALPVMQIKHLHLPANKKAAVVAMFMFGIFVCIASIVVLDESLKYDASSLEMPWNVSPIIIWATAEVNLAVVSACLPMLRPIWLLVTRRSLTKGSSGPYDAHSSGTFPLSAGNGTKLHTITVSKPSGGAESDGDSTHKLAGAASHREGSISSASNSDYHAHDANMFGPSTVITGQNPGRGQELGAGEGRGGGIVVTNEIGVKVSRVK